jgi:Na+-driven multidrug efflux pump
VTDRAPRPRPPARRLWQLAWPLMLTEELGILTQMVTVFWIGRELGAGALAVEAMVRPVLLSVTYLFTAVAVGGAVLTARSVGARDGRGLTLISSALALTMLLWLVTAAMLLAAAWPAAGWAATDRVSAPDLMRYFVPWLVVGLLPIAVIQVLVMAASAAGWTRIAMIRMTAQLCLAAVLMPVFIGPLGLGLAGPAVAHAVPTAGFAVLIWRSLVRQRARWNLGERRDRTAVSRGLWRELLDIGLPPQIARIALFAAQALLIQLVAGDGAAAATGFGIALLFLFAAGSLSSALSQAGGILMGQGLGARDPAAVQKALRAALVSAVATSAVVLAVVELIADLVARPFTGDPAVGAEAGRALRMMALSLPAIAAWQVLLSALAAVKATKRAGLLAVLCEAVGAAVAVLWVGDPLVGASVAIGVANGLRVVAFVVLARRVLAPHLRGAKPGSALAV